MKVVSYLFWSPYRVAKSHQNYNNNKKTNSKKWAVLALVLKLLSWDFWFSNKSFEDRVSIKYLNARYKEGSAKRILFLYHKSEINLRTLNWWQFIHCPTGPQDGENFDIGNNSEMDIIKKKIVQNSSILSMPNFFIFFFDRNFSMIQSKTFWRLYIFIFKSRRNKWNCHFNSSFPKNQYLSHLLFKLKQKIRRKAQWKCFY